ncbi:hypothetical protein D9619_006017 [Psilocybe cf. subviscida]|uniref:Uncharacterized protein n=1 Tax=Psilocybe cf. subviscida TaxID=2480587 RepID=A0A8H5BWW4_9AGAR|nr:hypothetical protein D9619_006017 [Psilocybe cf. subviscida]
MSVDEVAAWFNANITQPDTRGYNSSMFIELEKEAVEDGVCTVAWTFSGNVEALRCDFGMALQVAVLINEDMMPDGIIGCFHRSGVVITVDNFELAQHGEKYLVGMEVKIDEAWRDFAYW